MQKYRLFKSFTHAGKEFKINFLELMRQGKILCVALQNLLLQAIIMNSPCFTFLHCPHTTVVHV